MIDRISSGTKFPPDMPATPSVVERLRSLWVVEPYSAGGFRKITMSKKNYDKFDEEVNGHRKVMHDGALTVLSMRGVQLAWVADQPDNEIILEDGQGVFHALPF